MDQKEEGYEAGWNKVFVLVGGDKEIRRVGGSSGTGREVRGGEQTGKICIE